MLQGATYTEVLAVLHEVAGALHIEVAVLHVAVQHPVAAELVNSSIQKLDMKLQHNRQVSTEWDLGMEEVGVRRFILNRGLLLMFGFSIVRCIICT